MSTDVERPAGVIFIALLTFLQGALDILLGVLLLLNQNAAEIVEDFGGSGPLVTSAILYILLGVVIVLVARGLLRGSRGARLVVTVVQVLTLIGVVFLIIAAPSQFVTALISGIIALLIIALLWSGRSAYFFRH